jgi:hypothetical protein
VHLQEAIAHQEVALLQDHLLLQEAHHQEVVAGQADANNLKSSRSLNKSGNKLKIYFFRNLTINKFKKMKKILFLIGGLLLSSITINAQVISNFDGAVLFSDEDDNGPARYNAMSGAFGALGGDLSATDINPAGLSVFNRTEAAITLGLRNTDISTSFYGTSTANNNSYLNMTQAGAVLIFNNPLSLNWTKFALGINYSVAKDFENDYNVNGNSGIANFIIGPTDTSNLSLDPYLNYDDDTTNDIFYDNVFFFI